VVHISLTRTGELNGRHTYDGVLPCAPMVSFDTAITTSVPCRLWYDASHIGFGGPEHRFLS
jgi:hypothetical protein